MANAGGPEVGRVSIRVVPKLDGFREEVERELRRIKSLKIKVEADTRKFRQDVLKAKNLVKDDAAVKLHANTEEFKREVHEATKDRDATVDYKAEFDADNLQAKAFAAAKLASRQKIRFIADFDGKVALIKAQGMSRKIQRMLSQAPYKFDAKTLSMRDSLEATGLLSANLLDIKLHLREIKSGTKLFGRSWFVFPDTLQKEGYEGTFDAMSRGIRTLRRGVRGLSVDFMNSVTPGRAFIHSMRGFASLASAFGGAMTGIVAGMAAANLAIVAVGSVVGYVVDGVKQLSGSLLLIPGALGAVGFAGVTAFTAFRGMGNALSAAIDTSADLEEAISGLAPNAQKFARATREITPAWIKVRKAIQNTTFSGLGDRLKEVSGKQLPVVKTWMDKVAESTNHVFHGFADFAGASRTTDALSKGFGHTASMLENVAQATAPFLFALQNVGLVGLGALRDLSNSLPDLANKFNDWTVDTSNQEKMRKWIDDSVRGFKNLGKTVGNLWGAGKKIGNAFGVEFDGTAISKFEGLTRRFNDWLGDVDKADSNVSKFADTVQNISAPWIDTFKTAWRELTPAVQEAMPLFQEISDVFSDDLSKLFEKVGPPLEDFFGFLSDHKETVAQLVADFLLLRTALGAFKLGRAVFAPVASLIGSLGGGIVKATKAFGKGARSITKNSKKIKRAAKDGDGSHGNTYIDAEKADKKAKKAAKAEAKQARKAAKVEAKQAKKVSKAKAKEAKRTGKIRAQFLDTEIKDRAKKEAKSVNETKKRNKRNLKKSVKNAKRTSRKINRANALKKVKGGTQSISKGFGDAAKSAGKFTKSAGKKLGKFSGSVGKIGLKAGKLLGKGVARAIPFLGAAIMAWDIGSLIFNNWDTIKEKAVQLKDWFVEQWPVIKEKTAEAVDKIKEVVSQKWDEIKSDVSEKAGQIWDGVKESWNNFWSGIGDWIQGIWNGIKESASNVWTDAKEAASNAWNGVKERWTSFWSDTKASVEAKWDEIKDGASTKFEEIKSGIANVWDGVKERWTEAWDGVKTAVQNKWNEIKDSAKSIFGGGGDGGGGGGGVAKASVGAGGGLGIANAWDGVKEKWTSTWEGIKGGLSVSWDGIKSAGSGVFAGTRDTVSSAWDSIRGKTSETWSSVSSSVASGMSSSEGSVSGSMPSIRGFVSSAFSSIVSSAVTGMASFVSSVITGFTSAVSEAASLPGRFVSALGNLGGLLVSSGVSLVQGFISGIESMVGQVAAAASKVVSAARDFFPFSPAKRGPFSGKGYTTHSGKALVKDFAAGILSKKEAVTAATNRTVKAARKAFAGFDNPAKLMRSYHKAEVLDPVLESNAEKIADWREKQEKAEKDHVEKLDEIRKSKDKRLAKEKRIAKEEAHFAKKQAESRKELEESLEAPDYRDIDRSFSSYYIDGIKGLMNKRLLEFTDEMHLTGQVRSAALKAVSEGRRVFGDHPIFAKVEASVNSKDFKGTVQRVIEDAGIAEVPINFVVSNLGQLKSDLGMGDGVVSRAVNEWLNYNSNNSDAKIADDNRSQTEIHYHVKDMDEAIRLENLRQRKQAMRMKK